MGQLNHRLCRKYKQLPLSLGQLINTDLNVEQREALMKQYLSLKDCCVERHFAAPVLADLRMDGLDGLKDDLKMAFRSKTSNIEIETNFARASSSRMAMRGRSHTIPSMTAKHVVSEIKMIHSRMEHQLRQSESPHNNVSGIPKKIVVVVTSVLMIN